MHTTYFNYILQLHTSTSYYNYILRLHTSITPNEPTLKLSLGSDIMGWPRLTCYYTWIRQSDDANVTFSVHTLWRMQDNPGYGCFNPTLRVFHLSYFKYVLHNWLR